MSFLDATPGMVATVIATSDAAGSFDLSDIEPFIVLFGLACFVDIFIRLISFLVRKFFFKRGDSDER